MKRDAWYAAIAALGLCAAAGTYALIFAPKLADPKVRLTRSEITASLPSPPKPVTPHDTLAAAKAILSERDPFVPREDTGTGIMRGLELPKLGRPVQFSAPEETEPTAAAPVSPLPPAAQAPAAPLPRDVPSEQAPQQGSLTLRGVYPSPAGGRALVAMPDGSVVSVGVGGVVGGWRVLQIQQGAIRLGRGQRAILLAMPR